MSKKVTTRQSQWLWKYLVIFLHRGKGHVAAVLSIRIFTCKISSPSSHKRQQYSSDYDKPQLSSDAHWFWKGHSALWCPFTMKALECTWARRVQKETSMHSTRNCFGQPPTFASDISDNIFSFGLVMPDVCGKIWKLFSWRTKDMPGERSKVKIPNFIPSFAATTNKSSLI